MGGRGPGDGMAIGDDEVVYKGDVMWGQSIIGDETTTLDERGEGARAAVAPPSPKCPTRVQRERHNLTHLPYESWCPFCVAARKPNTPHRRSHESERELPLLVADYGFMRDQVDLSDSITILVVKVYPYKLFFLLCG